MTDSRAEIIHQADTVLMLALSTDWPRSTGGIGEVIAEAAAISHTMGRIVHEIGTYLPASAPKEETDAVAWAAQRVDEARQALLAVGRARRGEEPAEPTSGPLKLSTGGTLTPDPAKVVLTLDMLHEIARSRFGSDPKRWRFVCPACGDETAVGDFLEVAPNGAVGLECLGRYDKQHGCDHAAFGLIPLAPWIIVTPEGKNVLHFALAEAGAQPGPDLDSNQDQEIPREGESGADVAES